MSNKPFELRTSAFIEFERVEIPPVSAQTQAQTGADDTLDNDPLSVNYGRKKDHKATSAQRMLAGPTIDWLVAFPADLRPKALCDKFPHVANRLAEDWPQSARSLDSVNALIADARWGLAGFPAQVQAELQRLLSQLEPARRSAPR